MKSRLFLIVNLILLFCFYVLVCAEDRVDLSYKILESNNNGQILLIKVKLRLKNESSEPMHDVIAKINKTSNISIDKKEIYIGDVDSYGTKLSEEAFNIRIIIPSDKQGTPQAYTEWILEYKDANGRLVTQNITL